jgi:hypothetical protein
MSSSSQLDSDASTEPAPATPSATASQQTHPCHLSTSAGRSIYAQAVEKGHDTIDRIIVRGLAHVELRGSVWLAGRIVSRRTANPSRDLSVLGRDNFQSGGPCLANLQHRKCKCSTALAHVFECQEAPGVNVLCSHCGYCAFHGSIYHCRCWQKSSSCSAAKVIATRTDLSFL